MWSAQKFSHNCCIGGNCWDLFSNYIKWPHPISSVEISCRQMHDFFFIFNLPLNIIYAHLNEPHFEITFDITRCILVFISESNPQWGIASVWPKRGTFKTKSPFAFPNANVIYRFSFADTNVMGSTQSDLWVPRVITLRFP